MLHVFQLSILVPYVAALQFLLSRSIERSLNGHPPSAPTLILAAVPQVCRQYEKPLVLQLCRLVRGFTHPASYFASHGDSSSDKKDGSNGSSSARENEEDLALFSVDEFSVEMASVPHSRRRTGELVRQFELSGQLQKISQTNRSRTIYQAFMFRILWSMKTLFPTRVND